MPVLDEEERTELRLLRSQGWTAERLAESYGVSIRTIWRYLGDDYPAAETLRIEGIVKHWAETYALDLRRQERDALVRALSRRVPAA